MSLCRDWLLLVCGWRGEASVRVLSATQPAPVSPGNDHHHDNVMMMLLVCNIFGTFILFFRFIHFIFGGCDWAVEAGQAETGGHQAAQAEGGLH